VPIGAPAGPGAIAKVVPAPPYSLVVFVDPPQPVAGAPIALHVVIVDSTGEPAGGKSIQVTFEGPGDDLATSLDAESSPGRFVVPIPALDAGRWTATIRIGEESSGTYEFEVAR
jgi:hypothetical protein